MTKDRVTLDSESAADDISASPELLELDLELVRRVCSGILCQYGAPEAIASEVVEDLIASEREGYPTHGLMRVLDYVEIIKMGMIQPAQEPTVTFSSAIARNIDGQKGFGVIAAKRVVRELDQLLNTTPLAVVGLANSNHLGRLSHIGLPLSKRGFFVIGFVNYIGSDSQKVAPWRGAAGRFCTNPLLLGIPTGTESPIVIDFSTSTVSEGKIRLAMYNDNSVPNGWLVDENWLPVNDPARLYTNPPTAFMTPMGGEQGYKGFALSLFVDTMAGILTGGGFSRPNPVGEGSSGLFIAMNASVLGRPTEAIIAEVNELAEYCRSCPTGKDLPAVRMPGQRSAHSSNLCKLSKSVWDAILALKT